MKLTNLVSPDSNREDRVCAPATVEHPIKTYPTCNLEAFDANWLTSDCRFDDVHVEAGSPSSSEKRGESRDWKALTRLITERAEVTVKPMDYSPASSAHAKPGTGTTVMAPVTMVTHSVTSDKSANELDKQEVAFQACVPALHFSEGDAAGKFQVDMWGTGSIVDEWPGVSDLEEINDLEELAHNLVHSCLVPHCHPRVEALFLRAASGRGFRSLLIRASGLI